MAPGKTFMFDNVLGQEQVVARLKQDVRTDSLPSSLLLYGDRFTGKQTAALELARVLLCEEGSAAWNCGCPSCGMNRRLQHPGMVLIGPHQFTDEIEACADVYLRQQRKAGAYLFIRALEKCVRRFDPNAFEGSDSKEKKVRDLISAIEEGLRIFDPDSVKPEEVVLRKEVEKTVEKAAALAEEYPKDNIPIAAVRNISGWVHTTGASNRKVIIIENCERMVDGSRNALLKILEEPPKGVYFICITTRKGLIIPTILSRLRQYHFPKRTAEEEKSVLSNIFGETTGEYADLESFFLAWQHIKTDDLRASASQFIQCIESGELEYFPVLRQIADTVKDKNSAFYFFRFLTDLLREEYRGGPEIPPEKTARGEEWNREIQQCLTGINLYNQKPPLKIEELFFTMRRDT